ncbi:PREDICTED: uncharacterized protein LOC104783991 [Camelina sativa]|uniref:Uncharacterized protein LOC104783991 n=1 Tax=Camelina sativa TaxID=90675 RepID=A0ABM0YXD6_CAMSA|nr:PREDICTED: uncharacterized protein LOC104783991 [Camelina sativa]
MTKQHRSEQSIDDPTTDRKRFKWPPNLARGHLEICVEEKRKGNWQSKCLTEIGRMNLRAEFFKRFGLDWKYDKFRNRLDTVKRQHESYKRVIPDSSELRFCEQTGAIEMPFSWWENLIKEKPEAKTLCNYPIRDIPLIEQLFSEETISVGDDGLQHHDGASHLPFETNSVEDIELNNSPEAQNSEQPHNNGKRRRQIFMTLPDEIKKIEYLERMTGKKTRFKFTFEIPVDLRMVDAERVGFDVLKAIAVDKLF